MITIFGSQVFPGFGESTLCENTFEASFPECRVHRLRLFDPSMKVARSISALEVEQCLLAMGGGPHRTEVTNRLHSFGQP